MVVFYYLTWRKVAVLEKKTAKYSFDSRGSRSTITEMNRNRKKLRYSTRIAHQAYFYFGAFLVSWVWSTLLRLGQLITGKSNFFLLLMSSFMVPLQGFLNYFVYMRPRYLQYKKKHPNFSFFAICKRVFLRTFCCCCPKEEKDGSLRNSTNYFDSNTTNSSKSKKKKQQKKKQANSNELDENPTDMNNDDNLNIFDSGFSSDDVRNSSKSDKHNSSVKNNSSVKGGVTKANKQEETKKEEIAPQQDVETPPQEFTIEDNADGQKETTESQKEMEIFEEMFCGDDSEGDNDDDQLSNADSAATPDSLYAVKKSCISL